MPRGVGLAAVLAWDAPIRLREGRVEVRAAAHDVALARSVLAAARRDDYPGLPRPIAPITVVIAPAPGDFRRWLRDAVPEWGAAVAVPEARLVLLQGSRAGSAAGDPLSTLRHELAHLALHEALGPLPPRWFDEGYASVAAGEGARADVLATNAVLVWRRLPTLDALDDWFAGGEGEAQAAYALAHLAVEELAALDPVRGLSGLVREWRDGGRLDRAVRLAYGVTLAEAEGRWRSRVRWRYGLLSLVADAGAAGTLFGVLLLPLWLGRRRRDRERLAAMREAEARQDAAAQASALAALLATAGAPAGAPGGAGARPPPTGLPAPSAPSPIPHVTPPPGPR